ncbi:LysM peptidoglycan-binding domain-containing protein [Flavobacterium sp.]|uniref:LysM peptidoglycan-binding domain-containing protein n=1 Tax=Flavobacterium sp. TaxID=239 RepID=UPI00286BEF19|nr:LysM peptidoglycan-binding domain-containing protein [Flavobacterium sp.]
MKYIFLIICLLFFTTNNLFAQKTVTHKVAKGETLTQIAKKYNIEISDIIKLNPDAQKGVSENSILVIPTKKLNSNSKTVIHEVLPKETLYGISKQYNVEISEIEKANLEALKEGVKIGMKLSIPIKSNWVKKDSSKTEIPKSNAIKTPVFHEVKPKETKYSIAKLYNTTIEKLEKLNPEIVPNLPIGYNLLISGERPIIAAKPDVIIVETPKIIESPKQENILYTIKSKETLYSISTQFGVTQEELLALNPELKNGVQEGLIIKLPVKITIFEVKKPYKDLTKTFKTGTSKKLAMLLPFNIAKLDQDTINSTKSRLKKDKFLNMTLDFYAGALIAIDSVKKMGLNVDVTILDSDETKSTSNIASLIQQNSLKSFNAIIGPFYQNNAEKTAELMGSTNVPVISPLSKDYDKSYPNLFQATPSAEVIKNAMFDFMREKNGNVIAVIDPKKMAIKQYILENQKDVAFADLTESGNLNVESLKLKLSKDKINFVIMETERTNLILNTTNTLLNLLKDYQIRLVILQENDALDFDEIAMSRLTKLQMHYPSLTRVNDTSEAKIFENTFKSKNRIFPNQFATRGFDVTFDVLMRLSQETPFVDTVNEVATEQVDNKFYYLPNPNGGYTNKGVYILYYDTDLTIKEAK